MRSSCFSAFSLVRSDKKLVRVRFNGGFLQNNASIRMSV